MTPSRPGPRNPGHSFSVRAARGAGDAAPATLAPSVPVTFTVGSADAAGRGLSPTGTAAGSAKNSIIQECVQANRPDRCNCIQQCRQVAQCSRN
jgi:hypothetical protein